MWNATVNGVKLLDSRIQPVADANYALLDTGNPILAMASDVLAQITNAWAANPDVSGPFPTPSKDLHLHTSVTDPTYISD